MGTFNNIVPGSYQYIFVIKLYLNSTLFQFWTISTASSADIEHRPSRIVNRDSYHKRVAVMTILYHHHTYCLGLKYRRVRNILKSENEWYVMKRIVANRRKLVWWKWLVTDIHAHHTSSLIVFVVYLFNHFSYSSSSLNCAVCKVHGDIKWLVFQLKLMCCTRKTLSLVLPII